MFSGSLFPGFLSVWPICPACLVHTHVDGGDPQTERRLSMPIPRGPYQSLIISKGNFRPYCPSRSEHTTPQPLRIIYDFRYTWVKLAAICIVSRTGLRKSR